VAFFEAACWAAVILLNKKVLDYVEPVHVNFAVLVWCAAFMAVVAVPLSALHLWPLGFGLTGTATLYIFVSSIVTWLVAFNAYYYALRAGKSGVVATLSGTDPLFTALFAVVLMGATLAHLTVAGLAIAVGGVVLISRFLGDEPEPHAQVLEGALPAPVRASPAVVVTLSLVTAAGWGLGPVLIAMAEQSNGGASTTMMLAGELFGVVLLLPFVLRRRGSLFTRRLRGRERRLAWRLLAGAGFLNAVFAVLFYLLIQHIGAVLTTLVIATAPVFAIIGGAVFLRERIGARLAAGCAVTIAGVALALVHH
jgi:drug/metabolite transporter (DMT)-like permease